MGETWLGVAIGGAALAVALAVSIALHWLERRRARLLKNLVHDDGWHAPFGRRVAREAVSVDRQRSARDGASVIRRN
ncbi:hypothetical protein ACVBGC_13370 [Burkholderia stagnalis]